MFSMQKTIRLTAIFAVVGTVAACGTSSPVAPIQPATPTADAADTTQVRKLSGYIISSGNRKNKNHAQEQAGPQSDRTDSDSNGPSNDEIEQDIR